MNVGAMGTAINSASSAIAKIGANQALAKISKVMPEWMKDKPDWLTEDNVDDYFDTTGGANNHHLFRDPDAILNPSSDYELEYGLYDYNLDRPMDTYQSLPTPTYQTEFEDKVEGAGGFFSDYFEGPQTGFQGSPEDSRQDLVTRTGGPFERDGGPFDQEGGPFEDWRQRGEDGTSRNSVESRKTTAAPSSPQDFPHAIPDDVQFFEPNLETPIPSVPYVSYQAEHNPWLFLQSGESTDHLYRSFL